MMLHAVDNFSCKLLLCKYISISKLFAREMFLKICYCSDAIFSKSRIKLNARTFCNDCLSSFDTLSSVKTATDFFLPNKIKRQVGKTIAVCDHVLFLDSLAC